MFIVLPNKASGLKNFIRDITPKDLQELRWSMQKQEVDVRIPKFTFNYDTQLKETLKSVSMQQFLKIRNLFLIIVIFS